MKNDKNVEITKLERRCAGSQILSVLHEPEIKQKSIKKR